MRLLALLHRWSGGLVGLALALLGLAGALLVWEERWIALPYADAPAETVPAALARTVETVLAADPGLSRITFASDDFGLHQAIYTDGGGAYFGPQGQAVARWTSQWERPELWLFDLHHHLFAGETGETVTGVLGLIGLLFVATGTILWWRTRRAFAPRPWPARMTRPAIVRQHRDLGIIAAPLLLLSMGTGALMIFEPLAQAVLSPWGSIETQPQPELPPAAAPGPDTDWRALFAAAQARFPDAEPRRLQFPRAPGEPVTLRMRQRVEWTPNGRTYLRFDPAGPRLLAVEDPAADNSAQAIEEKFYPLHAAKVGGAAWKLAITFSGLALALLGTLSVWSFWFRGPRQAAAHTPRAKAAAARLTPPGGRSRKSSAPRLR